MVPGAVLTYCFWLKSKTNMSAMENGFNVKRLANVGLLYTELMVPNYKTVE